MKLQIVLKKVILGGFVLLMMVPIVFAGPLMDSGSDGLAGWKEEYDRRSGRTGFWILGAGAAVDKLPIAASKYTLPMVFFAYESIHKKALGELDFSWSFGLYDLMPEFELAVIIPVKPFDFRVSVGGYYDFWLGGHGGLLVKAGVILNKTVGLDIMLIPYGTQPSVSYSETLNKGYVVENDGDHGLEFPLFGVLLSTRF
jgi:hypothetical protein